MFPQPTLSSTTVFTRMKLPESVLHLQTYGLIIFLPLAHAGHSLRVPEKGTSQRLLQDIVVIILSSHSQLPPTSCPYVGGLLWNLAPLLDVLSP